MPREYHHGNRDFSEAIERAMFKMPDFGPTRAIGEHSFGWDRDDIDKLKITFEARLFCQPEGEVVVIVGNNEVRAYRTDDVSAHRLTTLKGLREEGEHTWIASGFAMKRYGHWLQVFASGNKPLGWLPCLTFELAVRIAKRSLAKPDIK